MYGSVDLAKSSATLFGAEFENTAFTERNVIVEFEFGEDSMFFVGCFSRQTAL
jgi:hypothetical protein